MSELIESVEDFIQSIGPTTKKEFKFIEQDDWTAVVDRKARVSRYDMHKLLTKRAVDNAVKLFKLNKGDIDQTEVKATIKLLVKFHTIFESRVAQYFKAEDWTTYLFEGKGTEVEMRAEVEFQSDIQKDHIDFKNIIKQIPLDSSKRSLSINTFEDKPIPLVMRQRFEIKFPELKEFAEKRFGGTLTNVKKPAVKKK